MFYLPRKFTHIATFGTTGTGKSVLSEFICEIEMINNKKKIVDLTNNRFLEGVGWCSPTRIAKFKRNMEAAQKKYGNVFKPRGIETEIYHPICSGLPKKLPPNFKPYTLPVDFFAYEEVLRVLTNDTISDPAMISLIQHIEKIRDDDSFSTIPAKIMESIDQKTLKTSGFENVPIYFFFDSSASASSANRPLMKMKNLGIISSRNFPYVLDDKKIRESLKDHKKITVFSTRYIDQRHNKIKLAINMYLLMKLRDLAKGTGNTVVYIREARELFPNQRVSDKALKVLGEQAESMSRDVRKAGIQLLLDTQSPSDLPDGVLDQISQLYIFRNDKKISDIIEQYRGTRPLDDERCKNIKGLRNHMFYIAGTDINVGINPFNGNTLDYKITDHLEKDEDELNLLAKTFPRSEWFQTRPYLELLAKEWRGSTEKMGKKYEHYFKSEKEKASARQIGITFSELRIFKYFNRHKDKDWHTFTDVQRSCGMAFATVNNALVRMHDRGFIKRKDNKYYGVTETGFKFIADHKTIITED